jgi:hypothetical protein
MVLDWYGLANSSVERLGTREVNEISLADSVNTSTPEVCPPPVLVCETVGFSHKAEQVSHGGDTVLAQQFEKAVENRVGLDARFDNNLVVIRRAALTTRGPAVSIAVSGTTAHLSVLRVPPSTDSSATSARADSVSEEHTLDCGGGSIGYDVLEAGHHHIQKHVLEDALAAVASESLHKPTPQRLLPLDRLAPGDPRYFLLLRCPLNDSSWPSLLLSVAVGREFVLHIIDPSVRSEN